MRGPIGFPESRSDQRGSEQSLTKTAALPPIGDFYRHAGYGAIDPLVRTHT